MVLKILHFLLSVLLAAILFYLIVVTCVLGIGLLINPWIGIPILFLFIIYQVRKWINEVLKEEKDYNDD